MVTFITGSMSVAGAASQACLRLVDTAVRVAMEIAVGDVSGKRWDFASRVRVTRVLATTFMIPTLMMYTVFVALMGAYVNVNQNEQTSFTTYFIQVFDAISFLDIFSSVIKSFVFGFTIGIVGCYKGYNSSKGTEGVGKAANSAVVTAMFLVFIEELLALQIITALR